jgi:protein phosphatase
MQEPKHKERKQSIQERPIATAPRPEQRQPIAENPRPAPKVEPRRESAKPKREPVVSTPIESPDGRAFWTGEINARTEGASSVKGHREQNEDAIILAKYSNGRAVAGVFDGMGGQAAGEVASQQAAYRLWEKLHQEYVTLTGLARDAISQAHLDIRNYNMQQRGEGSAGTTATTATTNREKIRIDHVGDSRALLIRGNSVYRLTKDHTLVAEQLAAGLITEEEARISENRGILTNAVGPRDSVRPFHIESNTYQWVPGDVLMLHSDGLSGLTNEQIANVINQHRGNLQKAASELNALAIRYGSSDNCSVVLIENPR